MFKKDGGFTYPSGTSKTVFNKGTLYVRRSASNHLADARDLDAIFERRQEKFREKLLGRIAKVVEAPIEKHLLLVSPEESDETTQKFVIDDAPDSIAICGMSFSVTPSTPVQEVASWVAMSKGADSVVPPKNVLWSWYKKRTKMELTEEHCIAVATFSILQGVPCFYAVADRTPRVYPWLNEPGGGMLVEWKSSSQPIAYIAYSTMLCGFANTAAGS